MITYVSTDVDTGNDVNAGDTQKSKEAEESNAVTAGGNNDRQILEIIISNQENMAKRIVKVEKGMQEIFTSIQNLTSLLTNNQVFLSRHGSLTSINSNMSNDVPIEYNLISDENELNAFEKAIEVPTYRKRMIEYFSIAIGLKQKVASRSAALQLERKMFNERFWSTTAWTGGRKIDGPRKFVFATHIGIISFMNEIIQLICGMQMSDSEFAEFVKSRTRNSGYVRLSNRLVTARASRGTRKKPELLEEDGNDSNSSTVAQISEVPSNPPVQIDSAKNNQEPKE